MGLTLERIVFVFIAVFSAAYAVILFLAWDYMYPWVDIPLHIAGGFWIGLLFFYLFLERQTILPASTGFIPLACLSLGFVAFMGVGWELYEYLSQVFVQNAMPFGGSLPGLHFDSLKDLFNDMLGGTLSTLLYLKFKRN